jgi:uncharacterized cupredoxin-like copper-binding protein
MAIAVGGIPGIAQDVETQAPGGVREYTLDATDYAFGWPDAIESGRIAVTMENNGQDVHHAQLVKLADGVSAEEVAAAFGSLEDIEGDMGEILAQLSLRGGPGIITPGTSQRLILDLEPGRYLWICGLPTADGQTHAAKGMTRAFEVVATQDGGASEPAADQTFVMADFVYGIPDAIPAGRQTWHIVNEGTQPHEMLLARLEPGATALDFAMAAFDPTATAPPPGVPVGGLQAIDPGTSAWLDLDLVPGTYAAICFVPDAASGRAHLELGMISEFTVGAAA